MSGHDIRIQRWTSNADFSAGTCDGAVVTHGGSAHGGVGGIAIGIATGQLSRTDRFLSSTTDYEYATWTSEVVTPGFLFPTIVPSFTAATPGRTWIDIALRGTTTNGNTTTWYELGEWAADDNEISRASISGQKDEHGRVDTDVLTAAEAFSAWQIRVRLFRPRGSDVSPILDTVSGVASSRYDVTSDPPSTPERALGVTLAVPPFAQHVHAGRYPQWNDGGASWCSPTSVSMIAAYWKSGPSPDSYTWVEPTYGDPWVPYAARSTYDHTYGGCGNWAFNAAYAGRLGLDAFVTRLRSLREVETFIEAGIPIVLSVAFKAGDIRGADYDTNGHLLIVVGFTRDGDPVLNDPAARSNAGVRKVFARAEFEAAWRRGSGGVAYVIRPHHMALPTRTSQPNW